MNVPRPGKHVIHNDQEEKPFNFSRMLRRHKSPWPFWVTLIMLIIVVAIYFFLQGVLK